ncbi:MAG: TRAP transporter small permease subunit [Lautropia sp.]
MILLIVPDVLLRKFFNTTIPGASEASVLLLVVLAYLGMAGAQARQSHFSADFLVQRLGPTARRRVQLLVLVLSLLFVLAVAWLTIASAWQSTLRGESSFGIVQFPIWPSRIAVAFGFSLLGVQLVVDIVRAWYGVLPQGGHDAFVE